jgi:hypothetical protein
MEEYTFNTSESAINAQTSQIQLLHKELLLHQIITQRKDAVNTIIYHWRKVKQFKLELKTKIIQYLLISQHIQKGTIINNYIKRYLTRKHISSYLSKKKTSYVIESSFSDKKGSPHLRVYIDQYKVLTFLFEYCSFLKKFVIYFPKNKINAKAYKVNFVSHGQIIINPNYPCIVYNNMFVNVIDFEIIKENELEYEKQFRKDIIYYLGYLQRKGIYLINLNYEEEEEEKMGESFSSADDGSSNDLKSSMNGGNRRFFRCVTFQRKLTSPKRPGFVCSSTKDLPSVNSNNMLTRPKSILKAMRRQSTNVLNKKVSFGNVQFSY